MRSIFQLPFSLTSEIVCTCAWFSLPRRTTSTVTTAFDPWILESPSTVYDCTIPPTESYALNCVVKALCERRDCAPVEKKE